eukprot:TRINITY_DN3195_c0_g1_i1.p1 TRINITY_DN3195_c0_g1~~TRINITY_DN3195_c0_g1_i1.p1  ORF type:complete len:389 (+),score=112.46 TRINITY_DN3195_c0_g1_i1:59-1225(+)
MGNTPSTTAPSGEWTPKPLPDPITYAAEKGTYCPPIDFKGESKITIPSDKFSISKEELIDRIKGTIYGNCIGDAIGLATEFMSKQTVFKVYGENPQFQYNMFFRDAHRGRWKEGDWTDDSDQMLLILNDLLAHGGEIDIKDFAQRLFYWVNHGFPELGDYAGFGLGRTVGSVVDSEGFVDDPHSCADKVWKRFDCKMAANGAVMRTSILGIPHFYDLETVVENTKKISLTTHADPRCTASCVAVTVAIAKMLQDGYSGDISKIIDPATDWAKKELDESSYEEFDFYVNAPDLAALKLDEGDKIGYTYKCFGSAFYCLRTGDDFKKSITELTVEAGDADTNAAVAGALLGCKLGYKNLPSDWLEGLKEKKWLDQKVDSLLNLLGLSEQQ